MIVTYKMLGMFAVVVFTNAIPTIYIYTYIYIRVPDNRQGLLSAYIYFIAEITMEQKWYVMKWARQKCAVARHSG